MGTPVPLLALEGIHLGYGRVPVVHGVSLHVGANEIVALIGPNGAGKTTTLRAIIGLLAPVSGSLIWEGRTPLAGLSVAARVRLGIAIAPEGRRLFPGMSVEENLLLGGEVHLRRRELEQNMDRVFALFPELAERRHALAGLLSGGQQQMCAIGRALMASPRLLLIDELSLGLSPVMADRVAEAVANLPAAGVSAIVIDQDVERALELAGRGYVMHHGRIHLEDDARVLLESHDMRAPFFETIKV